jgi:hypothetical protein
MRLAAQHALPADRFARSRRLEARAIRAFSTPKRNPALGVLSPPDPPPPQTPPFRLGRCAEDRLIILDGDGKNEPIDVFRDSEGKISYLRVGRMYRFTPA